MKIRSCICKKEGEYITVLLPEKQNKKIYKSLSGISIKSRHESPANSGDISKSDNCAKALQYAHLPGSLTVEAAFTAPLIIFAALTLFSLFFLLQTEIHMSSALQHAARIMAAGMTETEEGKRADMAGRSEPGVGEYQGGRYAKMELSGDGALADTAADYIKLRLLLREGLKEQGTALERLPGNVCDISFLHSVFSGDEIVATASYRVRLPISFGSWGYLPVRQQIVCKKWTGRKLSEESTDCDGKYVYITPYGSAYHESLSCRYLDLSVRTVQTESISKLRNLDGEIYNPCTCVKKRTGNVFITDYGTLYHEDLGCYRLKRTVSRVLRSETGSRHPCSKCVTDIQ